ncbi:cytochrome P450 [Irpex rosettiformis]|uniref:Cytochrome P450 n=1 Tax=Irpex rosettiformis TaxID=378272 RepID=A0ACB8TV61_9APHY|nr:cytochrome P450 [Irpex rosettiformis]
MHSNCPLQHIVRLDLFVFSVVPITIALICLYSRYRWSKKPVVIVASLPEIVALLTPPESVDMREALKAHAIPNLPLVRAFGITNTFSTDDPDVHRAFSREARSVLSSAVPNDADWDAFAQVASETVNRYILELHRPSRSDFTTFSRVITFRIVAVILFKVDPSLLRHEDVDYVTRGINELWALSTTTTTFRPGLLDGINVHLKRWIPQYSNPIDFVLPTYETMWRLIATSLAILHKDVVSRQTLADFLDNPLRRHFITYPAQSASVESIMKEILRIYPPTRGIFRAVQEPLLSFLPPPLSQFFTRTIVRAAEIGYLQRDKTIWGPDADVFDPMRHHPKRCTEMQQRSMLGFGFSSLKCVASNWAPHAAAIMVAAILERVGEDVQIVEGPRIGGREGWDGWRVVSVNCQSEWMRSDEKAQECHNPKR